MFRLRCWHKNHRWLSICTLTLDNIKPFYQTHYQTVIVLQMLLVWCCLQDVLGTWQSFHRTRQWWQVDRWHLTVIPTPTPDCHRTSVVISVMLSTGCVGYLTVVPQNTAVMTGRPLTLHCDTNTTTRLSWYFGHRHEKIFNGFDISVEFKDRHRVQSNYDLMISEVKLSDAGMYTCLHSQSHRATAEVIVIGIVHPLTHPCTYLFYY